MKKIQSLGLSKVILLYAGVGHCYCCRCPFLFFKESSFRHSTEKTNRQESLVHVIDHDRVADIMFVPVSAAIKTDPQRLQILKKHDLETYRLKWLFGCIGLLWSLVCCWQM
jgi:FHS family L-fucose permease-like MFS transporter